MSSAQQRKHDPHVHHRVGQLVEPNSDGYVVRRFPTDHVHIYGDDPKNLEVPGSSGPFNLVHVRCHAAPATAAAEGQKGPSCHTDSLVIAVHGNCPPQNSPDQPPTRSAVGVHIGVGNIANRACRVPDAADRGHVMLDTDGSDPRGRPQHTQQRADLYAAIAGLMEAARIAKQGILSPAPTPAHRRAAAANPFKLHHVVVKSDSAYLVEGVAGGPRGEAPHMKKWLTNGWKNARGEKVKNEDLWDNLMLTMMSLGQLGVAVEFWQVARKANREAERLARLALEQDVNFFDEKGIFGQEEHKNDREETKKQQQQRRRQQQQPETAGDELVAVE
ncbi:Putative ribonuclease H domain-containing protein [Colletotrichum destructivum]|uniref:Ribonuclease H domain-containing protein n=1 Tax=Colletotrichum destructivum TaxID=34406 RepID=A0AAX4ILZ1_9PEZI|nr:Putative ribonuclease H domain-containing protein [Colletotrichum destructivum]